MPKNAFLEPKNPNAVFPQTAKPVILDFRTHRMANGGLVAVGASRKHVQKNAKQPRYPTISKLAHEIEAEEAAAAEEARLQAEEEEMIDEVVPEKKPVSIDQLTAAMDQQMRIAKKSKGTKDIEMNEAPKISIKSRGIKRDVKKASRQMRR